MNSPQQETIQFIKEIGDIYTPERQARLVQEIKTRFPVWSLVPAVYAWNVPGFGHVSFKSLADSFSINKIRIPLSHNDMNDLNDHYKGVFPSQLMVEKMYQLAAYPLDFQPMVFTNADSLVMANLSFCAKFYQKTKDNFIKKHGFDPENCGFTPNISGHTKFWIDHKNLTYLPNKACNFGGRVDYGWAQPPGTAHGKGHNDYSQCGPLVFDELSYVLTGSTTIETITITEAKKDKFFVKVLGYYLCALKLIKQNTLLKT